MQFAPTIIIAFPGGKHDIFGKLDQILSTLKTLESNMATKAEFEALQTQVEGLEAKVSRVGEITIAESQEVKAVVSALQVEIAKLNDQLGTQVDLSPLFDRLSASAERIGQIGDEVGGFVEAQPAPEPQPTEETTV